MGGNTFGSPATAIRADNEAFDDVSVNDSRVRIVRRNASNVVQETLIDVNVVTSTFSGPAATDPELIVNTGEEATVRGTNIAGRCHRGIVDQFSFPDQRRATARAGSGTNHRRPLERDGAGGAVPWTFSVTPPIRPTFRFSRRPAPRQLKW